MALFQTLRSRWVPSPQHLSSLFHYVANRRQQIECSAWHGNTGRLRNMSNNLVHYTGYIYWLMSVSTCTEFTWQDTPHKHQQFFLAFEFWTTERQVDYNYSCVARQPPRVRVKIWIWTFSRQIAAQLYCNLCGDGEEMDKKPHFTEWSEETWATQTVRSSESWRWVNSGWFQHDDIRCIDLCTEMWIKYIRE